ncbi:hypothetical protein FN846DRAFT_1019005 [Sphaerosporella brunnea]|uniref:Uncharacterized protein n=1 Tax=Sphaerosporella brunnea TaxID=1250544 RepID=A0A5J5F7Z0_9PEZI|nr:hypothetical protein FN846DRAFT_1019005 [Sphaerosporella brunnea]
MRLMSFDPDGHLSNPLPVLLLRAPANISGLNIPADFLIVELGYDPRIIHTILPKPINPWFITAPTIPAQVADIKQEARIERMTDAQYQAYVLEPLYVHQRKAVESQDFADELVNPNVSLAEVDEIMDTIANILRNWKVAPDDRRTRAEWEHLLKSFLQRRNRQGGVPMRPRGEFPSFVAPDGTEVEPDLQEDFNRARFARNFVRNFFSPKAIADLDEKQRLEWPQLWLDSADEWPYLWDKIVAADKIVEAERREIEELWDQIVAQERREREMKMLIDKEYGHELNGFMEEQRARLGKKFEFNHAKSKWYLLKEKEVREQEMLASRREMAQETLELKRQMAKKRAADKAKQRAAADKALKLQATNARVSKLKPKTAAAKSKTAKTAQRS